MNKHPKVLTLGAGAAALALGGGLLTVQAVALDGSGNEPSSGTIFVQQGTTQAPDAEERAAERAEYLASLAEKLGVDVATLEAALEATSLEELDEDLADGSITSEQADSIREAVEAGEFYYGFGGRGGPHFHHVAGPAHILAPAELAEFLGMEESALREAIEGGSSLAGIAEGAGKTREELKAFLTEQTESALAEAVAAGRLTQEQADEKLAEFTADLDERIDSAPVFSGERRFRGGPPPGMPDDEAAPEDDSESSSFTS
jgi:hypothetical protein